MFVLAGFCNPQGSLSELYNWRSALPKDRKDIKFLNTGYNASIEWMTEEKFTERYIKNEFCYVGATTEKEEDQAHPKQWVFYEYEPESKDLISDILQNDDCIEHIKEYFGDEETETE